MLFPLSFDDLIPSNDPVRIINSIVNKLDMRKIYDLYQPKGALAYHPQMLLKILIYAYMCNTYSLRRIEESTANDVRFMWLAGMQRPDHNTINNFRSSRLKGLIKEVFAEVVILFNQEGLVSLKKCYTDGTKIEADANRYTFVWAKSIATRKEKIAQQLNELWEYADSVCKEDAQDRTPITSKEIKSDKIEKFVDELDEK